MQRHLQISNSNTWQPEREHFFNRNDWFGEWFQWVHDTHIRSGSPRCRLLCKMLLAGLVALFLHFLVCAAGIGFSSKPTYLPPWRRWFIFCLCRPDPRLCSLVHTLPMSNFFPYDYWTAWTPLSNTLNHLMLFRTLIGHPERAGRKTCMQSSNCMRHYLVFSSTLPRECEYDIGNLDSRSLCFLCKASYVLITSAIAWL